MESKYFLSFLGLILAFFLFNIFRLLDKVQETGEKRDALAEKAEELEKSKEKLSSDIEKLKTEEGKEEIIRENYGVAKEGENIIIITEEEKVDEGEKDEDSAGFWGFLKNWFK